MLALPVKLISILLVLSMGTAAVGSGVVWAASDSLPGDVLYPVKLATEDVRKAFASSPGGQVDLALQLVEERADEVQALVRAGRQVPEETAARLERHIQRALSETAKAGEGEMPGLLNRISVRTRTQARRLEQVQAQAPQQAQAGVQRALSACQRGAEAAQAGLEDPLMFQWRYQNRNMEQEPSGGQTQERYQHRNTPVGTPHEAPQGPPESSGPKTEPQGPPESSGPKMDPQGPPESSGPKMDPQGPPESSGPKMDPQGPPESSGPKMEQQGPQESSGPKGPGGNRSGGN